MRATHLEALMPDLDSTLIANREAVNELAVAAERCGTVWTTPRAPGKWSPSQLVEHVARSLEESANVIAGVPSKLPTLPSFVRPLVRTLIFNRIVRPGVDDSARAREMVAEPARG